MRAAVKEREGPEASSETQNVRASMQNENLKPDVPDSADRHGWELIAKWRRCANATVCRQAFAASVGGDEAVQNAQATCNVSCLGH